VQVNDLEKLRQWSWDKQGFARNSKSITEILQNIIGVYSPNPSSTLSLYARLNTKSNFDVVDLELNKQVIRIPAMRGCVFMVSSDDAATIRSASLPSFSDPCWDERYNDIRRFVDPEIQQNVEQNIESIFDQAIDIKLFREKTGLPAEMAKPMINKLCFQGKLNRIGTENLWANRLKYVSSKKWWGSIPPELDPLTSQIEVAEKYFRTFGPATLKDFAWWMAFTQSKAKEILSHLELVELEDSLMILADEQETFERYQPHENTTTRVLPQWDAYTMGYAPQGRERLVSTEHLTALYGKIGATGGNAKPCIIRGGKVIAAWVPKKKGQKLEATIESFEKLSAKIKKDITAEFEEIASFLKLQSIILKYT